MSDEHGSSFVPRRFVVAEFASPQALLAGTTQMRQQGYKGLANWDLIAAVRPTRGTHSHGPGSA